MIGLDMKYRWADTNGRISKHLQIFLSHCQFCLPLISYELAWDGTATPWVRGRRLRVWAMDSIKLMFREILQNESEKGI